MNQFNLDCKHFAYAEVLLLCFVLDSQTVFSQPEEKFSVENKILQEKAPASFAYSTLAPESLFSNHETTGAFYEHTKVLIRALMEKQIEEQAKVILPGRESFKTLDDEEKETAEHFIERTETKKVQKHVKALPEVRDIPDSGSSIVPRKIASSPLVQHDSLQGTINTLSYERIEGRGIRFRYTQIPEDFIGHFWWFEPQDLRGKTVRIFYSGIVPSEITFLVRRSYWAVETACRFHLEDSPETKILSFQVPNKLPFKEVSIFELRIEKARAGRPYGDFLIEKVEVVESDDALPPIEAENQSHPFPFGGPYLQSNIWGGEVRAS